MKLSLYTLLLTILLSFTACSQEEHEGPALVSTDVEQSFDPTMQLHDKDRIQQAEAHFLEQVKNTIKLDDKLGFKKLYFLDNANPEYVAMIDYVYNKKWSKNFKDLHYSIQANQKAQQHNLTFTVPYLGDLVIVLENKYGRSQTKVPVGIKDGVYFLTLGAQR